MSEENRDPKRGDAQVTNSSVKGVAFNPLDPLGIGKFWQEQATRAHISVWLDQDARTTHTDGSSAFGRYYQHVKSLLQDTFEYLPEPLRSLMKSPLKNDSTVQKILRSQDQVDLFRLIDATIRKRYPNEHGELYDEKYNHKFLTENSKGDIVAMDEDAVVKLFDKRGDVEGKGEIYPHIILTSSHAQGETKNDITSITHGIEALARDSEGKKLPHGYVDTAVKPGQTLTLYACDVDKSPWLNGAALMSRILELKRIEKTGEVETDFNEISPGAKRLAKLMLKCMVEDPQSIDTKDPRSMHDIAINREQPLRLRADAIEIAHHFQLIGYSKGGNVVSDALRYLVSELSARNAREQNLFEMHPESPALNGDGTQMNTHNISKIVRNIASMAIASVEVGMSDYYKAHGVRRVAFNNNNDLISAHHNYEDSVYDERWIIDGVEQHVGHAPQDMMGTRDDIKGYAHNDPRVARRLKEFFAPNYGKAAIGRVVFNGHADAGEVTIEAATGTTDRQIEQFASTIETAVAKALKLRPSGVKLTSNPEQPGIFNLNCKGVDFTKSANALNGLKDAFTELRSSPAIKGLLVTQSILDADGDIDRQIKVVSARGRG